MIAPNTTSDNSSKKFDTCQKIDSNTLINESIKDIETKTVKQIACAKVGMISVKVTTIASKSQIVKNWK